MPRVIQNDYFTSDINDVMVLLIGDGAGQCLKVMFDRKYLEKIINYKWLHNPRTNQVSSAVPRENINSPTRILLQHLICKLEWPEKIFKHVTMDHPHDFRVSSMRPKFHKVVSALDIGIKHD